jgi:predicted NAD/FAD-binding protein
MLHGEVVERFLLPLAAAIWSSPPADILRFPVLTLARFVHQHGMDTLLDHPTWKVIAGGSATYVPKLLQASTIAVHLRAAPQAVRRSADGVVLTFVDRPSVTADEVIFACHGDEVLPMLEDPSPEEQTVLGAFQTTHNTAALHTDSRWLPRRAAARAAWNYALDPSSGAATVTYHLNRLQGLEATRDYCVTLNPTTPIEPYHLLRTMHYRHPLYTTAAVASQQRWTEISGHRRTHYCGAYWFYGFHEDGLRSAVRVASMLGVRW